MDRCILFFSLFWKYNYEQRRINAQYIGNTNVSTTHHQAISGRCNDILVKKMKIADITLIHCRIRHIIQWAFSKNSLYFLYLTNQSFCANKVYVSKWYTIKCGRIVLVDEFVNYVSVKFYMCTHKIVLACTVDLFQQAHWERSCYKKERNTEWLLGIFQMHFKNWNTYSSLNMHTCHNKRY